MLKFLQTNRVKITRLLAMPFFFIVLFTEPLAFDDPLHEVVEIFGYSLLVVATIGRIWCAVYIAGRKNRELCRLGPYSLCRNPLYVFSFLGLFGLALGAQHILLALIVTPAYFLYYAFVIRAEEAELADIFGEKYQAYCRETPRIIPRFRAPQSEDVSPRDARILFRAVLDAQVFMWLLILLEVLEFAKTSRIGHYFLLPWQPPF